MAEVFVEDNHCLHLRVHVLIIANSLKLNQLIQLGKSSGIVKFVGTSSCESMMGPFL